MNRRPNARKIALVLPILIGLLCCACYASTTPDQPLGLKSSTDSSGRAVTISWEPVTQTAAGTPLPSLAGYNIYRRATPRGQAAKVNPYLLSTTVFADRINGQTYYYSVRAVDRDGLESEESLLVDSSVDNNVIFLAHDGLTQITLPEKLAAVLRPSENKYGVALGLRLKEESSDNEKGAVRELRFQIVRGDTKEEVNDIAFASPDADIHIGYGVVAGQVAVGAPDAALGASAATGAKPDQLSLYWFNGVSWIKLGGVHNEQSQTIDVKSARLGSYQLRIASPSNTLALNKANVFPSLFTPNGDGFNDRVYMVLENPNNASVQGEIFDIAGRHIITLPPPTQTAGVGTTLAWAGQDDGGATVPSGLYMYRIEGDGKTITGTVALAR